MMKIAVLVSGGGTNLQAILDAVDAGEIDGQVVLVLANASRAFALERARAHGIEALFVSRKQAGSDAAFNDRILEHLLRVRADLVVLAGYLPIVGPQVVRAFEHRILNIHPALIPSFCGKGFYGLHVHEAVLARGCKVTGATAHLVTAGVDEGPILLQKAVDVLPGDTPEILQRRVMEQAEWIILPEAAEAVAKQLEGRSEQ